ncbi:MAG: hypothetical protein A4E58_01211 [Syntrophorhabdus sp. PtaB.Bin006]|nr:MAG: hypothetical protein A4E58_01211 [Syntrophorhabdus sp. PtaB.Bin006]
MTITRMGGMRKKMIRTYGFRTINASTATGLPGETGESLTIPYTHETIMSPSCSSF